MGCWCGLHFCHVFGFYVGFLFDISQISTNRLYFLVLDVSTDGIWCYVVLWVVPHSTVSTIRWPNLKDRLISVCPSYSASFYFNQSASRSKPPQVYLLKLCSLDRKGLLHGTGKHYLSFLVHWLCGYDNVLMKLQFMAFFSDVTQVICRLELTIQRVKVTTTPDDHVLDLFFITDNMWVILFRYFSRCEIFSWV